MSSLTAAHEAKTWEPSPIVSFFEEDIDSKHLCSKFLK